MDKVYTKALVLDYKIDFRVEKVEKVQVRLYLTNVSNALTQLIYKYKLSW